jgi:YVTN family beta-propeller protein
MMMRADRSAENPEKLAEPVCGQGLCEPCEPPSNICDLTFSTETLDCSDAYPALGTPPTTTGNAGFVNFGAPQVSPILRLRAHGSPYNKDILVLNPMGDEVTVLDRKELTPITSFKAGLGPSSIAQTRKGKYILVSNWTSDNVSVIDSKTLRIVASIDSRGPNGEALLIEPMGIVSPSDEIAYVASSGTNQIAVLDLITMQVSSMIDVPTPDPRALALTRNRKFLAVAGFAALNRTEPTFDFFDPEVTGIGDPGQSIDENCGPLATAKPYLFDPTSGGFMAPGDPDFRDAFNCYVGGRILSLFSNKKLKPIDINPRMPDHDVAIIRVEDNQMVFSTNALAEDAGTLNYDLAWSRNGKQLFLANTHARNELGFDFEARPFLNRLTRFAFDKKEETLTLDGITELDLDPGDTEPDAESRAATPYAITYHKRDQWLVTAAASNRVVMVDDDGVVLKRFDVGVTPRGIIFGKRHHAFVFNASSFSVQLWNTKHDELLAEASIGENSMPEEERLGQKLFNSDQFSTNFSFSCASCHPDGDTDHLTWELNCADGLRLTMTLRQIANTLPYHWPGDKCNGKKIMEDGVMGLFGQPTPPSDCDTDLTWQFIESFRQPPPNERATDDRLSPDAMDGLLSVQRATYKTLADTPVQCDNRQFDPIAWPRLRDRAGDPTGDTITFNFSRLTLGDAENNFIAATDAESCTNSGCHGAPGFGNGTFDGFVEAGVCAVPPTPIEAITFIGAHDRMKSEDDGRSAMYDFLVALDRYRNYVGATGGTVLDSFGVPTPGSGLKGFLGTFFRHAELDYDPTTEQGFVLTDRVDSFIHEAATGPSAITGRQATATATNTSTTKIDEIVTAADAGKVSLLAHGSAGGAPADLVWDSTAQHFTGTGGPISLTALLASIGDDDAVTFTGALPLGPSGPWSIARDEQPFLISVTRTAPYPHACSEEYPIQLADFSYSLDTGPVDLVFWGTNIDSTTAVLVNGQRTGTTVSSAGLSQWAWTLPSLPLGEETIVLQLQRENGLMSNEFAALVIP